MKFYLLLNIKCGYYNKQRNKKLNIPKNNNQGGDYLKQYSNPFSKETFKTVSHVIIYSHNFNDSFFYYERRASNGG